MYIDMYTGAQTLSISCTSESFATSVGSRTANRAPSNSREFGLRRDCWTEAMIHNDDWKAELESGKHCRLQSGF